ncbi:vWA domain-containing protein [Lichenifustis flavocetrariae]|uniref:vWA domain-containing protein n=1 Tax=Lichenifustis flavocetrariae TaxID=2949735 RepID=UPI0031F49887
MTAPLPRALKPFVQFATVLRANGFAVAPEQTQAFVAAVGLLGPVSMRDIHRAAVPTLAPPPERREEFDALFRQLFHGQTLAAPANADPEDDEDLQVFDAKEGEIEPPEGTEDQDVGGEATAIERLTLRQFRDEDPRETLRRFARAAPAALPRQRSFRRRAAKTGDRWHMRRLMREAVRRDGEVLSLPKLTRTTRQRRILLLVDVSGSMKAHTDDAMSLAHVLVSAADRAEVFTLGTRLTRVTRALRLRRREQALGVTASLVSDWDGGTRLGDALDAFLHVPRFASFARGSLVVVLSDGLERGDPAVLTAAVGKLSTLAWRVAWLTPLAADAGYTPSTAALKAVLPFLDHLGNGAGLRPLCDEILALARRLDAREARRVGAFLLPSREKVDRAERETDEGVGHPGPRRPLIRRFAPPSPARGEGNRSVTYWSGQTS